LERDFDSAFKTYHSPHETSYVLPSWLPNGLDDLNRPCIIGQVSLDGYYSSVKFLRAFLEALHDAKPFPEARLERDFPPSFVLDFLKQSHSQTVEWGLSGLFRILKYYTVALSAAYLDQDVPPPPVKGVRMNPFSGRARRALDLLLLKKKPCCDVFFNTILQGLKRGCHPAPDSFEGATRVDHIVSLTKNCVTDGIEDLGEYVDRILESLPILKNLEITDASPSATFESSRKRGGGRGFLLEEISRKLDSGGLVRMYESSPGVVVSEYATHGLEHWYLEDRVDALASELLERSRSWSGDHTWGGSLCRVAAIMEPLKVRLITAGDSWGQYIASNLQRNLWRWMQTIPAFRLTGRSMEGGDLADLSFLTDLIVPGAWTYWVSGDYKAATDNLNMDVSRMILDKILKKMDPNLYLSGFPSICRAILLEQMIVTTLPKGFVTGEIPVLNTQIKGFPLTFESEGRTLSLVDWGALSERYPSISKELYGLPTYFDPLRDSSKQGLQLYFLQTNGQLMGSVLSFPILCIANLACYWKALEDRLTYERKIAVSELPVLVNGDDILFRSDKKLYMIWKKQVDRVGFKLSVGKNYFSRKYCMVNSQMRVVQHDPSGNIRGYRDVSFLNIGLLTGQAKVTGRSSDTPKTLDGFYNKCLASARDRVRIHRRFLYYNKELIAKESRNGLFNLFLRPVFGGLGFDLDPIVRREEGWFMTPFQERLSEFLYRHFCESRPLSEREHRWLATKIDLEKDVWKYFPGQRKRSETLCFVGYYGPVLPEYDLFESPIRAAPLMDSLDSGDRDEVTPGFTSFPRSLWKKFLGSEVIYWKQGLITISQVLYACSRWFIKRTVPKDNKLDVVGKFEKTFSANNNAKESTIEKDFDTQSSPKTDPEGSGAKAECQTSSSIQVGSLEGDTGSEVPKSGGCRRNHSFRVVYGGIDSRL